MNAAKRAILRWIHLFFAIPIIGYVYTPFKELPKYAPVVRFIAIPALALTGLWTWKGPLLRRLISYFKKIELTRGCSGGAGDVSSLYLRVSINEENKSQGR
jgi:glucose-6-phosphate-specific signal transduction histidine kinase